MLGSHLLHACNSHLDVHAAAEAQQAAREGQGSIAELRHRGAWLAPGGDVVSQQAGIVGT
eukprot:1153750-Pelagomonas_calceolata.AAC.6